MRKICSLDDHVLMAFAGLTADARVLIKQARVECQSHKLTVEDPVTLEYITRHVAFSKFIEKDDIFFTKLQTKGRLKGHKGY